VALFLIRQDTSSSCVQLRDHLDHFKVLPVATRGAL